jgi:hypothetical protein
MHHEGHLIGWAAVKPRVQLREEFELAGRWWRVGWIQRHGGLVVDVRVVPALSPLDRQILILADQTLRPGTMANRIRELGLTETAFYARLDGLLDNGLAHSEHPRAVGRLRRLRGGSRRWMRGVEG